MTKVIQLGIKYVVTNKIYNHEAKKYLLNYYTGQEKYGQTMLTGWNIYRKYAHIFTDKDEANTVCGKLRKLVGSEKAKVKIFEPFSKN